MANINRTKVITGKDTRLSYFNGWEPKSINGGPEKYSVSLLIPKDDKETINAIEKAIDAAIEEGSGKFGGKILSVMMRPIKVIISSTQIALQHLKL